MSDYKLTAFTPILEGQAFLAEITAAVEDWWRIYAFRGGPWLGGFRMRGEKRTLEQWFYEQLGAHIVEESYGDKSWYGMAWTFDFVYPDKLNWNRIGKRGRRLRRSYDALVNRAKLKYTDPDTNSTGETSWSTNAASITRYGRKDDILYQEIETGNANDSLLDFLGLAGEIEPEFVGVENDVDEPYLDVTVTGYVGTAQMRFIETDDDSSDTVSGWVNAILNTDCEFLSVGRITSNSKAITRTVRSPMRAWSQIEALLDMKDASGNRYNVTIDPTLAAHYEVWQPDPVGFFWNGRFVSTAFEDLEEKPRLIKPGIYRDLLRAETHVLQDTERFFQSPNDFFVAAFEVDSRGRLLPRLSTYSQEESLRSLQSVLNTVRI